MRKRSSWQPHMFAPRTRLPLPTLSPTPPPVLPALFLTLVPRHACCDSASRPAGYMAATQSRSFNLSAAPKPPAAPPPPDHQIFGVDFSLAEARSKLAALDVSSAAAASASPSSAAASSPVARASSGTGQASSADSDVASVPRTHDALAPSVADVRKELAAKRRLALQQATQRQ